MKQACTIYSGNSHKDILVYLENEAMHDASTREEKAFERDYPEGHIRITVKWMKDRGDEFSSLLRGTWNFFEKIDTRHLNQKGSLTRRILDTKTAIDIVAAPEFEKRDSRLDVVFGLAAEFDGIIFNGASMVDKKGLLILDSEGNSDQL